MRPVKVGFLFLTQPHADYRCIAECLSKHNRKIESTYINLSNTENVTWSDYDIITVRDCRNYHLDPMFLSKLEAICVELGPVPLVNSLEIIRAAVDKKSYLRDLQSEGVSVVPTIWPSEYMNLEDITSQTQWQEFVVKPTISSKSWNTFRVTNCHGEITSRRAGSKEVLSDRHDALLDLMKTRAVCVQQFMPEICSNGELSFVFIDNRFSHAIRKTVALGNWVAHESFGGENKYYEASKSEVQWARDIFTILSRKYGEFLYARIDGIPNAGKLYLLECELIVPRLFLIEANAVGTYVDALISRVQ